MYNPDMKSLIKYAIELDIESLKTFNGYKGGDILAFETTDKEVIVKIKKFCHNLEVDTNVKVKGKNYTIFCEFGFDRFSTADDLGVYELK